MVSHDQLMALGEEGNVTIPVNLPVRASVSHVTGAKEAFCHDHEDAVEANADLASLHVGEHGVAKAMVVAVRKIAHFDNDIEGRATANATLENFPVAMAAVKTAVQARLDASVGPDEAVTRWWTQERESTHCKRRGWPSCSWS